MSFTATSAPQRRRLYKPKHKQAIRRIEVKYYDTGLAATAIAAPTDAAGAELDPSATSMISTPAVGDASNQRDGNQIRMREVEIRGTVQRSIDEAVVDPPAGLTVYLALVLDNQSNGAQMNSEDCFVNTAAAAATAAAPFRNLLFRHRFQILKHQWFDMSHNTLANVAVNSFSTAGVNKEFVWRIPLRDMIVNFNSGTTASIANVVDKSIHLIGYATISTCFVQYNARIRFTD